MRLILSFLKFIIEGVLRILIRIKFARVKPTIIGITGSFGKTTTKEAIYEVLRKKWRVYRNPKSLNTEIGLLLAVLEQPSGFSSPLKWIKILVAAMWNTFTGRTYDFFVLEYGADKPGDIGHLVNIVKPHIGIITHIAAVHQAEGQFKNAAAVFEEKKKLVTCLEKSGTAILNGEDEFLEKLKGELAAKTFWFGKRGDISADNLKNTASGFSATLHKGHEHFDAKFPVAGSFHIDAFLPALLCGLLYGLTLKEGIAALQNFKLPPGRMSIIPGKNSSTILDSSYNASPETVKQALDLLKDFPGNRKIAVLGNMNELGDYAEDAHCEVARYIGPWLDQLIAVGDFAKIIAEECLKNGFPKARIKILKTAEQAGEFLIRERPLEKGDVILFKGSQNLVRLERAVKMLMARPEDAKILLCRQEKEWESIQ